MNNIPTLTCIESRIENSHLVYSQFRLGPFEPGQALTVANSLRRTLLSQIKGWAIVAVEIDGVSHEYESLRGIREPVLDVLLNLKQIILRSKELTSIQLNASTHNFQTEASVNAYPIDITDNNAFKKYSPQSKTILNETVFNQRTSFAPQMGFLEITGPCIVRAKDLNLPPNLQCVDPNQYIATLSYNGKLKLRFLICQGKNYLVQTALSSKYFSQFFKKKKSIKPIPAINSSVEDNYLPLKVTPLIRKKSINPITEITENNTSTNRHSSFLNISNTKEKTGTNTHIPVMDTYQNNGFQLVEEDGTNNGNGASIKSITEINSTTQQDTPNETELGNSSQTDKDKENTRLNGTNDETENLDSTIASKEGKKKKPPIVVNTSAYFSKILTLDSQFTPISRVNYMIEKSEKINESQTFYETIFLEIWTNGSIQPKQTIYLAIQEVLKLFAPFRSTLAQKNRIQKSKFAKELDIANLELTLSTFTILKKMNIHTLQDLEFFYNQLLIKYKQENTLLNTVQKEVFNELKHVFN